MDCALLRHSFRIFFAALLMLCASAGTGRAADAPAAKPAVCGGYLYMLPEWFTELHLHREFAEFLSLSECNDKLSATWRSAIICITVENKAGNEFITDKVKGLITGSELQKHPLRRYPERYEAELPDGVRLYTFGNQYHSETERDFSRYMLELKASGNEDNVLLYVLDEVFSPVSKDDPRTPEQVEADKNRPRKERAALLIDSVRRLGK